jgi:hypothetical protein
MITEYTTFNDVRAALGVGDKEITDATLGLELWSTQLDEFFYAVSPSLLTTYQALDPEPESRTSDENRFVGLLKLTATYAVAASLLDSAELFGFLKVGDGRAATERTPDAYKKLRENILASLARIKALLLAVLGLLDPLLAPPAAVGFLPLIVSRPSADPVTG